MTSVLVAELISKAGAVGTNLRHVTRGLGIPDDKVKNWMRGTAEPSTDEVKRICEKLGVDIPKTKVRPTEKVETPAAAPAKERESKEKASEVKPAKDDFMPKPELFAGKKPVEEDVLKAFVRAADSKFVVGEVAATKKEEKKMNDKQVYCTECAHCRLDETGHTNCNYEDRCESRNPEDSRPISERPMFKEIKNQPKEQPKESEKPKRTRTASPKKSGKKQFLSEESETFVRKTLGLKKSEALDEKAIAEAYKTGVAQVKQKLDDLAKVEKDIAKAFFNASETSPVDGRLKKLLEAADKASDEGITVAITILEKFRK